jgi:hypothetical protein
VDDKRITFVEHDFFQPQPLKNAPIYFMRYIIHDWPDKEAQKILKNVRDAMSTTSRLLICDRILVPTYHPKADEKDSVETAPSPLLANWANSASSGADLLMMANFNAKERTVEEFRTLVNDVGLRVENLWFQNESLGILECVRGD